MKFIRKKNTFVLLLFFLGSLIIRSQSYSVEHPIADMLDSLSSKKIFDNVFFKPVFPKNNKYKYREDSIPMFDDNTYQSRLAKLDVLSPFDLVYNEHVKGFINLYMIRKRSSLSRMMGVSQLYYPMFEEVLDKYNIPLELKHLAIIESALIPYARSGAGATGLWQFMYPTGKIFGLKVDSYIDERCNPYKATVAAAEYLKSLYAMFNDWQMVLAAYNAGPGTISKAIRRSGGKKTYWEIRPYLPLETQGYVPAFIAANYAMNYADDHNIYATLPRKTYFEVDTVVVKEQMTFDQISQALDISSEEILYFNPQYRKNIIPSGGNVMCLPKNKIAYFLNNEIEIYSAIQAQKKESLVIESIAEVRISHIVKKGEKLSSIARKYGVRIQDIKSWNYIGKRGIKPGKRLVIYVREHNQVIPKIDLNKSTNLANIKDTSQNLIAEKSNSIDYILHKVKKGETLYQIAKKNNVKVSDIINLNNLKSNRLVLGSYLKIKKINK